MGLFNKVVSEPKDWDNVWLARNPCDQTDEEFFRDLEGDSKYNSDADDATINGVDYTINRISIVNFDDLIIFQLKKY